MAVSFTFEAHLYQVVLRATRTGSIRFDRFDSGDVVCRRFETAKAISAAIRVLNVYSEQVAHSHMDQAKLWTMLWQYTAAHTPLWKVINTANGEFYDLSDPKSPLKQWLLPGTQNYWIAESGCADPKDMGEPAWTDVADEGYEYNQ